MKTIKIAAISIVLSTIICCTQGKKQDTETNDEDVLVEVEQTKLESSLFDRLGGTEGIASIVDNIMANHMKNPVVKDKFSHLIPGTEHYDLFVKHVNEFLASGSGGEVEYSGKDMVSAHTGFNITPKEYLSAIDDILLALDSHGIDHESKKDLLFILYSLKDPVIGK